MEIERIELSFSGCKPDVFPLDDIPDLSGRIWTCIFLRPKRSAIAKLGDWESNKKSKTPNPIDCQNTDNRRLFYKHNILREINQQNLWSSAFMKGCIMNKIAGERVALSALGYEPSMFLLHYPAINN